MLLSNVHVYQLHFQLAECDFFLAHLKRTGFLAAVLFQNAPVVPCGSPQNGLEGRSYLGLRNFFIGNDDLAAFRSACRFRDDKVALPELFVLRGEIVDLATLFETDADDFDHRSFLPFFWLRREDAVPASIQAAHSADSARGRLTFAASAA